MAPPISSSRFGVSPLHVEASSGTMRPEVAAPAARAGFVPPTYANKAPPLPDIKKSLPLEWAQGIMKAALNVCQKKPGFVITTKNLTSRAGWQALETATQAHMKRKIERTDLTHIIFQSGDPERSAVELACNSWDAGSPEIQVQAEAGHLTVLDTGKGMNTDVLYVNHLSSRLSNQDAENIGRFGVGSKTALRHLVNRDWDGTGDYRAHLISEAQVILETLHEDGTALREVQFVQDGDIQFFTEEIPAGDPFFTLMQGRTGTRVQIFSPDIHPANMQQEMEYFMAYADASRPIYVNGELINPKAVVLAKEGFTLESGNAALFEQTTPATPKPEQEKIARLVIKAGDVKIEEFALSSPELKRGEEFIVSLPVGSVGTQIREGAHIDDALFDLFLKLLGHASSTKFDEATRWRLLNLLGRWALDIEADGRNHAKPKSMQDVMNLPQQVAAKIAELAKGRRVYPNTPFFEKLKEKNPSLILVDPQLMPKGWEKDFAQPETLEGDWALDAQGRKRKLKILIAPELGGTELGHYYEETLGVWFVAPRLLQNEFGDDQAAREKVLTEIPHPQFRVRQVRKKPPEIVTDQQDASSFSPPLGAREGRGELDSGVPSQLTPAQEAIGKSLRAAAEVLTETRHTTRVVDRPLVLPPGYKLDTTNRSKQSPQPPNIVVLKTPDNQMAIGFVKPDGTITLITDKYNKIYCIEALSNGRILIQAYKEDHALPLNFEDRTANRGYTIALVMNKDGSIIEAGRGDLYSSPIILNDGSVIATIGYGSNSNTTILIRPDNKIIGLGTYVINSKIIDQSLSGDRYFVTELYFPENIGEKRSQKFSIMDKDGNLKSYPNKFDRVLQIRELPNGDVAFIAERGLRRFFCKSFESPDEIEITDRDYAAEMSFGPEPTRETQNSFITQNGQLVSFKIDGSGVSFTTWRSHAESPGMNEADGIRVEGSISDNKIITHPDGWGLATTTVPRRESLTTKRGEDGTLKIVEKAVTEARKHLVHINKNGEVKDLGDIQIEKTYPLSNGNLLCVQTQSGNEHIPIIITPDGTITPISENIIDISPAIEIDPAGNFVIPFVDNKFTNDCDGLIIKKDGTIIKIIDESDLHISLAGITYEDSATGISYILATYTDAEEGFTPIILAVWPQTRIPIAQMNVSMKLDVFDSKSVQSLLQLSTPRIAERLAKSPLGDVPQGHLLFDLTDEAFERFVNSSDPEHLADLLINPLARHVYNEHPDWSDDAMERHLLLIRRFYNTERNSEEFLKRVTAVLPYVNFSQLSYGDATQRRTLHEQTLQTVFDMEENPHFGENEIAGFEGKPVLLTHYLSQMAIGSVKDLDSIVREENPKPIALFQGSVIHAVTHLRNAHPSVWLRELFQNSLDEIDNLEPEDKKIETNIVLTKNGRVLSQVRDFGGMSKKTLLEELFVPEKSAKQGKRGRFGIGFWSMLNTASEVRLRTAVKGSATVLEASIIPIRDPITNKLIDVEVNIREVPNTEGFYGTLIERESEPGLAVFEYAQQVTYIKDTAKYINRDRVRTTLNSEPLNQGQPPLVTYKSATLGEISLYRGLEDALLISELKMGPLPHDLWQSIPAPIRQLVHSAGVYIGLDHQSVALVPTRDRFMNHERTLGELRTAIPGMILQAFLKLLLDKKSGVDWHKLPEVYFIKSYGMANFRLDDKTRAAADALNSGNYDIDYSDYEDPMNGERNLLKLLTALKFIPNPQKPGEVLSLSDLYAIHEQALGGDTEAQELLNKITPLMPEGIRSRLHIAKQSASASQEQPQELENFKQAHPESKFMINREYSKDHPDIDAATRHYLSALERIARAYYGDELEVRMSTLTSKAGAKAYVYVHKPVRIFYCWSDIFQCRVEALAEIENLESDEQEVAWKNFVATELETLTHELTHVLKEENETPDTTHDPLFYDQQIAILLGGQISALPSPATALPANPA